MQNQSQYNILEKLPTQSGLISFSSRYFIRIKPPLIQGGRYVKPIIWVLILVVSYFSHRRFQPLSFFSSALIMMGAGLFLA